MPQITIKNNPALDGDYPLDFDAGFNGDELHLIKQISGVRRNEMVDAMRAGDHDLIVAFAKIAIERSGKDVTTETLLRMNSDDIDFEPTAEELAEEVEEAELPPASAPRGASEKNSEPDTSTTSSTDDSASPSASVLPLTGNPSSVESSASGRETLAR